MSPAPRWCLTTSRKRAGLRPRPFSTHCVARERISGQEKRYEVPASKNIPPEFFTVPEVADLLRTSVKAIYSMVERGQLPGVIRIGRRVLVNRCELIDWLDQKSASSP